MTKIAQDTEAHGIETQRIGARCIETHTVETQRIGAYSLGASSIGSHGAEARNIVAHNTSPGQKCFPLGPGDSGLMCGADT